MRTTLNIDDKILEKPLLDTEVACHDLIIGELACSNLKNRNEILALLKAHTCAPATGRQEFLYLIDKHQLMERGIGFVDVH